MSRKIFLVLAVVVVLLGLTGGLTALTVYYQELPERVGQHEAIILGQNRLVPGSQAALRVIVRDTRDAAPLPDAAVHISMRPAAGGRAETLFTGVTDAHGNLDVAFTVPATADPNQTLIIETESALGSDRVERPVTLTRDYRVLISTDKPLYQPGQIIHLRALALGAFDLAPAAGQPLEFAITDGGGNRVFRQTVTTSEFGVAATDFQLASEVNTGAYKITVTLGNTTSEQTVTVEYYVLPKFAVNLSTTRPYYQPGEHVEGRLNAAYFFGKPVSEGQVTLEGYTFDFERTVVFTIQGITDDEGNFEFDFDLPTYLAGSDWERGAARFYLQATVVDQAEHAEVSNLSLPVTQSTLVIEAIPEGGQFRPGVENILYVLTGYPDGRPAETEMEITLYETGQTLRAQTGAYGLAEVRFTPSSPWQNIGISARDAAGNLTHREFYFEGDWQDEAVLLRTDAPIYRVGDVMTLNLLTSQPRGTVYVDIIREGQTISTRAVPVENGQAQVAVDLAPQMVGTLEVHAYKILSWGGIVRDTRLVVVDAANDLSVSLTPGADIYRPGETATLDIQVSGVTGEGTRAALGLAIVDESVFALAEQDPGFARLYFMLERELLTPRYELHGFSIPDLIGGPPIPDPTLRGAVEDTARASLAAAAPQALTFSLQANSHEEAVRLTYERQATYFKRLGAGFYGLLVLLPLATLLISGLALRRHNHFWRSLGLALALLALPFLLLAIWPMPDYGWKWTFGDRLDQALTWLVWNGGDVLLSLAGLSLVSFIILIVMAVRDKDGALGWLLAALPLFAALLAGLVFALSRVYVMPDERLALVGLIAFALLPLAFLLRAAGFAWERRALPAGAALLLALFVLTGTLPALGGAMAGGMGVAGWDNAGMVVEEMVMEVEVPVEVPMAMEFGRGMLDSEAGAPLPTAVMADENAQDGSASANEPPRLRQYFPETMLWLPDEVTDDSGALRLEFPVADSITTWRMTALASTQDGRLGSATGGLRVFQDFFVDIDLPGSLTVGDEIAIPVGVFNYLPTAQTVRLEVQPEPWFDLLDETSKELVIESNDITVVYFRIRAREFGMQPFQITAWGSAMSDAIRREVRVYPDGRQITFTASDRLTAGQPVVETVNIPFEAIPGTQRLVVKIYPGVISQIVEGLDALLRMPSGCFEQTSSTTYPNILVLDYLLASGQIAPEVQMKAEQYINLGYQRLTTFEVNGSGGFSLFGDAPADPMLTAYGLQEFNDMSRVHDVDPALIQRISNWLFNAQQGDGSWRGVEGFHESSLTNQTGPLPVTAYIVWGLADAGFGGDGRTTRGVEYLRTNAAQAEDAYTLSMIANALVAYDLAQENAVTAPTQAVLDRLAGMAVREGNGAYWEVGTQTYMGGYGEVGNLETTAQAALALLRAQYQPDLANAALTYLIQNKDSYGTWQTTSATIMGLKAMLASVRSGSENINATVTVTVNGGTPQTVQVTRENFDVVQMLVFDAAELGDENTVEIVMTGEGNLMYQVAGSYYLPWEMLSRYPELIEGGELVTLDVTYDRAELAMNDTVGVDVTVTLNEGQADSAIVDLGLPPGFSVEASDLQALVAYYQNAPESYAGPRIKRYELTGRQIIIYVTDLTAGETLNFSYRLRARFPLRAQTPASAAYDYYNPTTSGEQAPLMLMVTP